MKVEVILDEKPLTVKTSKVLETADEDPGSFKASVQDIPGCVELLHSTLYEPRPCKLPGTIMPTELEPIPSFHFGNLKIK